ncbi:hypothetical protein B5F08_12500 [Anaeromassilibacillus sp. An172]|uniref:hypothetical protein n=1 Tax=Anaeromassilibacillus sp. An172 TaxID=1965570 RepID=UPI000B371706|nr:hypothetical protein [Anaeromassilibacillus sp. An172]OUP74021.1 hypothetical protein B5F08_12500 [Anaeromassilibacillus sp. An172]
MGIYNTNYENYSQSQLTALFSSDTWKSLSFSQRLNACQEVENRYAAENNVHPCTITYQPMNGACYGWQNGNTICLNSYLLQDGQFCTDYKDSYGNVQSIRTDVLAPGWNTLDTVFHEGTHGIQEQSGRMPSTYISPEMDGDLYRIQGIEKEAYANGQIRTLEALSNYEKEVGHMDPERSEYIASIKADSFQAALIDASQNYNDPNIEQTLQTVINDRENGISRTNTSESYDAINNLCDDYGIHSSADVSTVSSTQTIQPDSENSETEVQLDDGLSHTDHEASIAYQLDDGLLDSSTTETTTANTAETPSYEDGSEEFDTTYSSDETLNDDGFDNFTFDNATPEQDDGFSYSDTTSDYGSTEQSYISDGLDDSLGTDSVSSSDVDSTASNESGYSE